MPTAQEGTDLRSILQAIHDKHDQLTPELVVQEARDENHPLHHRVFDRSSEEASEAWYRHRAHELIQSVRIIYRPATDDKPAITVRGFVAVPREGSENGTGASYKYEPAEEVVGDPQLKKLALQTMEREWKQLKRKFEEFEEFAQMVERDLRDENGG